MTKKIFAMFLAVLMVVSMLPTSVFAADCPAVHTKNNCEYTKVGTVDPNCGQKGYTTYKCNACDETFVADFTDPVGEHSWKDADPVKETCEKNGEIGGKECTVCGYKVGATTVDEIPNGLKCEFGEWLPATIDCTTGGKQVQTCAHCGNENEREVPKSANGQHDMTGEWELKTPATAEAEGLAVLKCKNDNCGYYIEQAVFFDHDHDDSTMIEVAKVDAKCEEPGVSAHYVCRVCEGLFKKDNGVYKATTKDALKIQTKHEKMQKDDLNCKLISKVCPDCKKVVSIELAKSHSFGSWTVSVTPTCLTNGFRIKTCSKCGHAETELVDALGHDLKTVEVAATCVSYAFSYTYCTRPNCTTEVQVELPEEHAAHVAKYAMKEHALESITVSPAANTAFYLALQQNSPYVQLPLYFTGEMDGNFFATSSDYRDAVKVYAETKDNGFYLYFMNGSVKTYLDLEGYVKSNGKNGAAVKLTTESPEAVWSIHQSGALVATVEVSKTETAEFALGTYNEYKTISASATADYAPGSNGQFNAKLCKTDKFVDAKVTAYNINKNGGVDSTDGGHDWKVLSEVAATCLADGIKVSYCADNCGVANKTETLTKKADHQWVMDEEEITVVTAPTCTTAGKGTVKCEFHEKCGATKEIVLDALGHDLYKENNVVKVHTEPGNHMAPLSYKYNVCTRCHEKDCTVGQDGNCDGKCRVNKSDYKAWANAGKLWDDPADAQTAHDNALDLDTVINTVNGSCFVDGYNAYKCDDCSEIVRIKIEGTGEHTFNGYTDAQGNVYSKAHQDATCTAEGWNIVYFCEDCDKWVDNGVVVEAEEVKLTKLDKIAHAWVEFTAEQREAFDWLDDTYTKSDCKAPRYDNWTHYCETCNYNATTKVVDGTNLEGLKADQIAKGEKTTTGALCEAVIYELYDCHCGKTHMRGFLSNIGHNMVSATKDQLNNVEGVEKDSDGNNIVKVDSTCYATGYEWKICTFCNKTEKVVIAKKAHKNEAKEEWTDSCLDDEKVTDRHCVVCHEKFCNKKTEKNHTCASYKDSNNNTIPACDCMIKKDQHVEVVTKVDSICGDAPYTSTICSVCFETTAKVETEYWTGKYTDEANTVKEMAPIDLGLGHKPVAVDTIKTTVEVEGVETEVEVPVYYGQYTYKKIAHPEYVWAKDGDKDVVILKAGSNVEYEAKFIEYKAATVTADGFAKFDCADCGKTVEVVLPATAGLDFTIEYVNANGAEEITVGSVVNVTIYASGADVAVNTFTLNAQFKNLVYVASQSANDNFRINVTDAKNANGDLVIVATAINTADKKQQNITIGEKTPVVTLQFVAVEAGKTEVTMTGEAFDVAAKDAIACSGKCELVVETFLDFNEDGFFHISDLIQAETVLTGESEKTYDVVIDVDKDGEITLFDLNLIYEFYVNEDYTNEKALAEFACYGLSDVHAALVDAYLNPPVQVVHCKNPYCLFSANTAFETCPACNRAQ